MDNQEIERVDSSELQFCDDYCLHTTLLAMPAVPHCDSLIDIREQRQKTNFGALQF
jgi:hypothetical protein